MAAYPPSSIAIVGLAGRLPGAPDVQAFWRNLEQGVESLAEFSDEELIESGVPAELFGHPDYVRKGTVLENADLFDAGFFGYNPREAEMMDPQQRFFWSARGKRWRTPDMPVSRDAKPWAFMPAPASARYA